MKTRVTHTWEQQDPSITFVTEALNRLRNFQNDETDQVPIKSVNRVLNNCDFEMADIFGVNAYLEALAVRAEKKWAPDTELAKGQPQVAESIAQNVKAARDAANQLMSLYANLSTV